MCIHHSTALFEKSFPSKSLMAHRSGFQRVLSGATAKKASQNRIRALPSCSSPEYRRSLSPYPLSWLHSQKAGLELLGRCWTSLAMGFPYGILLFILTKWQVDKDLMKQRKTGKNTQASNMGEYESQRFRASSQLPVS
uniref:Uncharacterized protein n=1 Tax=Equus caballus TaxID=9796 RepID=A0A3Q2KP05_HORSE